MKVTVSNREKILSERYFGIKTPDKYDQFIAGLYNATIPLITPIKKTLLERYNYDEWTNKNNMKEILLRKLPYKNLIDPIREGYPEALFVKHSILSNNLSTSENYVSLEIDLSEKEKRNLSLFTELADMINWIMLYSIIDRILCFLHHCFDNRFLSIENSTSIKIHIKKDYNKAAIHFKKGQTYVANLMKTVKPPIRGIARINNPQEFYKRDIKQIHYLKGIDIYLITPFIGVYVANDTIYKTKVKPVNSHIRKKDRTRLLKILTRVNIPLGFVKLSKNTMIAPTVEVKKKTYFSALYQIDGLDSQVKPLYFSHKYNIYPTSVDIMFRKMEYEGDPGYTLMSVLKKNLKIPKILLEANIDYLLHNQEKFTKEIEACL